MFLKVALFLSTTINKLDKKGRISLPANFRAVLNDKQAQSIVLFKSPVHECLEGFDPIFVEEISGRLDDGFDMFSTEQDDLATALFGEAVQLSLDETGRMVLPELLVSHAGLDGEAAFIGLGKKFQIWNPEKLQERRNSARSNVKSKGLTLPVQRERGGND